MAKLEVALLQLGCLRPYNMRAQKYSWLEKGLYGTVHYCCMKELAFVIVC
jgi:hypothetical protein